MTTPKNNQKEYEITPQTKEKAELAKAYIEKKYSQIKSVEEKKIKEREEIDQQLSSLNISETEKQKLISKIESENMDHEQLRSKRKKLTIFDYEPIAIIGRGAFGEVRLCRFKENMEIVALKKMKKSEMMHKNQVAHVRAERDILSEAKSDWIVELKNSFQDEKNLQLVMEYLPGGDLMTLLMKKDILSEEEARFQAVEMILAIESVHSLNYIHRDLKPDNVLLGQDGHVKLSDFGLCKHADIKGSQTLAIHKIAHERNTPLPRGLPPATISHKKRRHFAYSTVGTPDQIAPEVFCANGQNETVDWWSVGVILFEMLCGQPPFFSDEPSQTCKKILQWKKQLTFPTDVKLSEESIDLMKKLITDHETRLGRNGIQEIKEHPFFASVEWTIFRKLPSVYIPVVKNEIDTSNFDHFDEEEPFQEDLKDIIGKKKVKTDLNFVGQTYKREQEDNNMQRGSVVEAMEKLEKIKQMQNMDRNVVRSGLDRPNNIETIQNKMDFGSNSMDFASDVLNPTNMRRDGRNINESPKTTGNRQMYKEGPMSSVGKSGLTSSKASREMDIRTKGLNKENTDDIYSKIQKDYGGADLLNNSSKIRDHQPYIVNMLEKKEKSNK